MPKARPVPRSSWRQATSGLIDAIVGLWLAPVTPQDGKRPAMKVKVDQDKCISSGQCVSHASEVFDQRDEDGVAVLLTENPAGRAG